jgi:hypothetical protein
MTSKQPVNAPLILTVGAISCLLLVVIMFGIEAWFRFEERGEIEAKYNLPVKTAMAELKKSQLDNIERAGPSADGKVHYAKIEDAMQAIVKSGGKMPATQPSTQPTK